MEKAVESSVTYLYSRGGHSRPARSMEKMADVQKIISRSVEAVCGEKHIDCDISVARHLWSAEGDEEGLTKVLNILVSNAAEDKDIRTIKIRAENISIGPGHLLPISEGRYIRIRIDEVPRSKDLRAPVSLQGFEPGDMRRNEQLAECWSIIESHGGLIFSESRAGIKAGTIVYLPASDKDSGIKQKEVGGRKKVLIMDDEEIIRVVAKNMLHHLGYDVEVAGNGDEALSLFWREKTMGKTYDAVILDLTVRGGMGGAETMKRLVAIDAGINAIVSSGYTQDPILADFKRYGFKAVLPKPYKMADLGEVLKSVIQDPLF